MTTKSDDLFDDVVDQRYEHRRHEMNVALRWSAVLTFGFVLVTLDVINQGLLYKFDQYVAEIERPKLSGFSNFVILRIDDLGLRWVTASILLVTAALISRRFKSWRPLNLSFLSLVFLNVFVGAAKIGFGRCKARENFDVCMFTDGTFRPTCRPIQRAEDAAARLSTQRPFYSGHKKRHGFKFQGVMLPNGLFASLHGSWVGRRNDGHLYRETGINSKVCA